MITNRTVRKTGNEPSPEDNRRNFVQVPPMTKPIPAPMTKPREGDSDKPAQGSQDA